jgi:hypothetical protein
MWFFIALGLVAVVIAAIAIYIGYTMYLRLLEFIESKREV